MRRTLLVVLLAAASFGSTAFDAHGKETKWAVWGSSGGAAAGGTSWWVDVRDGATSFFASTRGFFLGRGTPEPAIGLMPGKPRSRPIRPVSRQPWFPGVQPKSRAEGGSSQTIEGFVGDERPQ